MSVPGSTLFVRQEGLSGPWVVLVHGQPGSSRDWEGLAHLLGARTRVIRYDRPGWGRSAAAPCGISANAMALDHLVRSRAGEAVNVVGHSLGAAIAVELAARAPDIVSSLTLVNPAVTRSSLGTIDRLLAKPMIGAAVALPTFQAARIALSVSRVLRRSSHGPLLNCLSGFLGRAGALEGASHSGAWRSFLVEQRSLVSAAAGLEVMASGLSMPVTLVGGRRDRLVPATSVTALASSLRSDDVVWLEGGHLLPWEAPLDLARIVLDRIL